MTAVLLMECGSLLPLSLAASALQFSLVRSSVPQKAAPPSRPGSGQAAALQRRAWRRPLGFRGLRLASHRLWLCADLQCHHAETNKGLLGRSQTPNGGCLRQPAGFGTSRSCGLLPDCRYARELARSRLSANQHAGPPTEREAIPARRVQSRGVEV